VTDKQPIKCDFLEYGSNFGSAQPIQVIKSESGSGEEAPSSLWGRSSWCSSEAKEPRNWGLETESPEAEVVEQSSLSDRNVASNFSTHCCHVYRNKGEGGP